MLLLALLLTALPSGLFGQSTCPPDHPAGRAWVNGYLTGDFGEHRRTLALDGVPTSEVRALSDVTDLAMCQRLVAQFGAYGTHPNWYWSAYRVRDYYFVAWRFVNTNGGLRVGLAPMLIFDQNFVQVGGFAS
jgi:hypothetical protein